MNRCRHAARRWAGTRDLALASRAAERLRRERERARRAREARAEAERLLAELGRDA